MAAEKKAAFMARSVRAAARFFRDYPPTAGERGKLADWPRADGRRTSAIWKGRG